MAAATLRGDLETRLPMLISARDHGIMKIAAAVCMLLTFLGSAPLASCLVQDLCSCVWQGMFLTQLQHDIQ